MATKIIKGKNNNSSNVVQAQQQQQTAGELVFLNIKDVQPDPNQPREYFDKAALQSLVSSIEREKQLEAITVRVKAGKYLIVSGERRYRALMFLKRKEILARIDRTIKTDDEAFIKGIHANWFTAQYTDAERENIAYKLYKRSKPKRSDAEGSEKEVADILGVTQQQVNRFLKARKIRASLGFSNTQGVAVSTRTLIDTEVIADLDKRKEFIAKILADEISNVRETAKLFADCSGPLQLEFLRGTMSFEELRKRFEEDRAAGWKTDAEFRDEEKRKTEQYAKSVEGKIPNVVGAGADRIVPAVTSDYESLPEDVKLDDTDAQKLALRHLEELKHSMEGFLRAIKKLNWAEILRYQEDTAAIEELTDDLPTAIIAELEQIQEMGKAAIENKERDMR